MRGVVDGVVGDRFVVRRAVVVAVAAVMDEEALVGNSQVPLLGAQ